MKSSSEKKKDMNCTLHDVARQAHSAKKDDEKKGAEETIEPIQI